MLHRNSVRHLIGFSKSGSTYDIVAGETTFQNPKRFAQRTSYRSETVRNLRNSNLEILL
jgi:hypothetical protein